jgi:hypothetical protein
LRHKNKTATAVGFCFDKCCTHPGDVGRLAFDILGIHLGRAAEIVVASDNVQRCEGYAVHRPAKVLAELGVLRILGLTFHRDGTLAETVTLRKEHGADFGEALQRVNLGLSHQMAISPIVVTGRQDKRMPYALE